MDELIQFGGAIFDAHCPKCKRITKPRKSLNVNSFMAAVNRKQTPTTLADCDKCGPVEIKFKCFEKVA